MLQRAQKEIPATVSFMHLILVEREVRNTRFHRPCRSIHNQRRLKTGQGIDRIRMPLRASRFNAQFIVVE